MKKSEIQSLWHGVSLSQQIKTKDELTGIIDTKAKKAVNKFLFITAASIVVGIGVIIFLTITTLNRTYDTLYVLNNALLGFITITLLFSTLWTWYRLSTRDYSQSVKEWLGKNIRMISASLHGKNRFLHILVIPTVYILILLSINVYFSNKLFVEVFCSEDSVIALIVGVIVGLSVSFYVARKIRNYHLKNLKELEELFSKVIEM